jgi:hypothetical protein
VSFCHLGNTWKSLYFTMYVSGIVLISIWVEVNWLVRKWNVSWLKGRQIFFSSQPVLYSISATKHPYNFVRSH